MANQSVEGREIQRSASMLAPPIKLNPAFNDPDQIINLIEKGAPYLSITTVHKDPPNDNTPGWFRNFWALGGKVVFDGAEEAFYNPNFIQAAKQSFNAEIIQPLTMMTNLNVPAADSPPHLDLPFFRGAHAREVPSWMLAPMGYSELFPLPRRSPGFTMASVAILSIGQKALKRPPIPCGHLIPTHRYWPTMNTCITG